jgi:hypothetical protein
MNAPNIFVCAPYAAANSPRETAARELPAPHSTSHHRASIELGDASTSERMDRSSEGENVDAVEVEGERTESDADTPSASPVVRECRSDAILHNEKKMKRNTHQSRRRSQQLPLHHPLPPPPFRFSG